MRIATSTTPPWVQIDHQLAGMGSDERVERGGDAGVQAGDRLAAGIDHPVGILQRPVRGEAGDEVLVRHPVALVARVELGEALVDADLGADHRGDELGRLASPGGRGWRRAPRRASSPVRSRRLASSSHCARPASESPPHVRKWEIVRVALPTDSPWRISTMRVPGRSSSVDTPSRYGLECLLPPECQLPGNPPRGTPIAETLQWAL